jgi:hypothetical protein
MGTMSGEEAQCSWIHEVLRDHVRFFFNRMEGKLELLVFKEFGSVRMISKPFAQTYSIAIGQLE